MPLIKLIFFLITITFNTYANAQDNLESHDTITLLNTFSPLETAGAHGSQGFSLGSGVTQLPLKKTENKQLNLKDEQTQLIFPRLWFTKGLIYPLDFGGSIGSLPSSSISVASGYLQWTLYEALKRPALAIRSSYSELFGLETTSLSSTTTELITSWGFRHLSFYGSLGYAMHRSKNKIEPNFKKQTTNQVSSLGFKLMISPPFFSLALEGRQQKNEPPTISSKIAIGF